MNSVAKFYLKRGLRPLLVQTVLCLVIYYGYQSYPLKIYLDLDLGGCKHVYVDVGSNVGIQVRKLFEPDLYPKSGVLPVYDKYFGSDVDVRRKTVCAVGFEPNKAHTERLKMLEDAYNKCGWRAHFLTETAVSDYNGFATLFTDNNVAKLEWGASLIKESINIKAEVGNVKLVRLNDFLLGNVLKRKLNEGKQFGKVLMKLDIEGSEVEVLNDILANGGFVAVDAMMVEFHERRALDKVRRERSRAIQDKLKHFREANKSFDLLRVDDESNMLSDYPLPKCL